MLSSQSSLCLLLAACLCARVALADDQKALLIIKENCQSCHNAEKHKGGLQLTSRDLALKGSDDGPVLQPGKSSASKMIEVLAPASDPHMPPKGQLTAAEIEILKQWIDAGANWPVQLATTAPATRPVVLQPLPQSYRPVLAIALSLDGKKLAAGRGDRILIFD